MPTLSLDAALRQHVTQVLIKARDALGSRAAVTIVLQVLADDRLSLRYCVGVDEGGKFKQLGMDETWPKAIDAAKHELARTT